MESEPLGRKAHGTQGGSETGRAGSGRLCNVPPSARRDREDLGLNLDCFSSLLCVSKLLTSLSRASVSTSVRQG